MSYNFFHLRFNKRNLHCLNFFFFDVASKGTTFMLPGSSALRLFPDTPGGISPEYNSHVVNQVRKNHFDFKERM